MTKDIERKIRKAQPRLRKARPLPFWIIVIFAGFNIALGISLYLSFDAEKITAPLLVVNELFTFRVWGIVFVVVGLIKMFSLATNRPDVDHSGTNTNSHVHIPRADRERKQTK